MDATTMRSMSSLIRKLKTTYPDITFLEANEFLWSPSKQTVQYTPHKADAPHLLLHELSHGLLGHRHYRRDIELLAMETSAWEKARELADQFSVKFNEDVMESHLDTYREWMHARSICPNCSSNGYQTDATVYECPACSHRWKVNEARICALRRYSLTNK